MIFDLAAPPRLTKGAPGRVTQVWVWLKMSGQIQPKVVVSDTTHPW